MEFPKKLFGRGALRSSSEDLDLRPQYDLEKVDAISQGLPFPEYQEWKMMKLKQQPALTVRNQF